MGTPHFAVPSLTKLIEAGYDVAAVVTQPDRKRGRGHKLSPSPVKEAALIRDIPVLQFDRIKSKEGVAALKAAAPDLIVTAAFGQILSKEILDMPRFGCINVHASLLPKYRGAAPIQWAIIKGETKSGVTIMYMDEGLDTGDIIAAEPVEIPADMTGGQLYEQLAVVGADLLVRTMDGIVNGTEARRKQNEAESTYDPPLCKQMGQIDWTQPASTIVNLVRGLNPVMSAYAHIGEDVIKIWEASAEPGSAQPAHIVCADEKQGLLVGTGDGLLRVKLMQAPGTKRMKPQDYLRGRKLPGEHFE